MIISLMRSRHCCALPITTCLILHLLIILVLANLSQGKNTLKAGEVILDSDYLESNNKYFRLRFIPRPWSPQSWYLGIECVYMHPSYTLWVTFPEVSTTTLQPRLIMDSDGQLNLWLGMNLLPVNADQPAIVQNTTATLLDNANLVLTAPDGRTLWQSFDYPSNTWLPGMKLGLLHGRKSLLTSWTSEDNPSPGAFTLELGRPTLDPTKTISSTATNSNATELVAMQRGMPYWRSGEWTGKNFTFLGLLRLTDKFDVYFSYFSSENESYFTWKFRDGYYTVIRLETNGVIELVPMNYSGDWVFAAVCDTSEGEALRFYGNDTGCINRPSVCGGRNKFNKTSGTIDKWDITSNSSLVLSDCKAICRNRCSCDGYTSAYSDGTGCKFAISGKYRYTFEEKGDTIYLRLEKAPTQSWKWKLGVGLAVPLFLASILICLYRWRQKRISSLRGFELVKDKIPGLKRLGISEKGNDDLPFFSFLSIKIATDDFSDAKKLGQGGFGPVYKGKLFNGQEIAVNRLLRISGHGIEQFKNEVILISKLQHRNLVRLLGYCNQGDERLLVYEYLPNKSLDSILFDATKQALLDWKTRVNIIEGVAQGILYLHKYSRLKIIHRDLKTSNILLDNEMNPKISDFGTARIFQDHDSRATTKTIVGTYGYMSPEYAMDGLFSEKSDVFSFGVMVLEIISGKKNTSFYHPDRDLNLLGYAWDLWKEGRVSDFADPTTAETFSIGSGLRYVHIGLLCVQENAADRPTMLDVVSMLMSESTALPAPKQPAFSAIVSLHNDDCSKNPQPCSINNVTLSDVQGR